MDKRQEGGFTLRQGTLQNSVSNTPRISIITVTFNAASRLSSTFNSITSQNYSDFEWIVIDGGSTDNSVEWLRAHDDRIAYWVSEADHGMYDALTKGFERAQGEILCWLNAGDIFLDGALSIVAEVFQQYPEASWITGINFWHLPGNKIIRCHIPPAYDSMLITCGAYGKLLPYIQQESTFFRRTMLASADMEKFRQLKLAGDLYLWSCFAKRTNLKVVCAGLGSFCIDPGPQLSDDKAAYWREAETFLEPLTLASRFKALLRKPLNHAPLRIKKFLARQNLLLWNNEGWS
jgi:glycosyltransferase involved in cell wall biosynthesis